MTVMLLFIFCSLPLDWMMKWQAYMNCFICLFVNLVVCLLVSLAV